MSDLVGIPFKLHGRDRTGMDCWGLCMEFFRRLGITLQEYDYDASPTAESDMFARHRGEEWLEVQTPQEGDIVCMAFNRLGVTTHCGIYLEGGRVLHAIDGIRSAISPWRKLRRFVTGIYRHSGVVACQS